MFVDQDYQEQEWMIVIVQMKKDDPKYIIVYALISWEDDYNPDRKGVPCRVAARLQSTAALFCFAHILSEVAE